MKKVYTYESVHFMYSNLQLIQPDKYGGISTRNDSNKIVAKIKSQLHSRLVSLVYHLSDNIESCLPGTGISVLPFQDGW